MTLREALQYAVTELFEQEQEHIDVDQHDEAENCREAALRIKRFSQGLFELTD